MQLAVSPIRPKPIFQPYILTRCGNLCNCLLTMKLFSAILAAAAVACATAASGPRDDWQRVGRSHPRAAVEFSVAMPNSNLEKLDDLFWKISTPGK